MYKTIKKFCDALKSGEYEQTTSCLSRTVDGVRCYCALGVALETFGVPSKVYREIEEMGFNTIGDEEIDAKAGDLVYGYRLGRTGCEASTIRETVTIDGYEYHISRVYPELDQFRYELSCLGLNFFNISAMNDQGKSFHDIANTIEEIVESKDNV